MNAHHAIDKNATDKHVTEYLGQLVAFVRDVVSLSDDEVLSALLSLGTDLLGAREAAAVRRDASGSSAVVAASSEESAAAQVSALNCKTSPLSVSLSEKRTVAEQFLPANGWFDAHGRHSLNRHIHHEFAVPAWLADGSMLVCVWSRDHELSVDEAVLGHLEVAVAVAEWHLAMSRSLQVATTLASQLATALQSRVVIEQAKGVLAGRNGSNLVSAFAELRRGARASGRPLVEVAGEIVSQPGGGVGDVSAQPGMTARRTGRSQPG